MERLRTYGGHAFMVSRHLDRFARTLQALGIDGLPTRTEITNLVGEVLTRNEDFVARQTEVGITLFATPGIMGANLPTFAIHLNTLDHQRNQVRQTEGQTLVITDVAQPPEASWPRSAKVRSRLHYYRADRFAQSFDHDPSLAAAKGNRGGGEANRGGPSDAIGVLVDQDGSVTETSIANLAIVENQTIYSPETNQVLSGITQAAIEELAAAASIAWKKERLSPTRFANADEILCMGTDGGIWFARSVLPEAPAIRTPGKIYSLLRAAFAKRTSEPV